MPASDTRSIKLRLSKSNTEFTVHIDSIVVQKIPIHNHHTIFETTQSIPNNTWTTIAPLATGLSSTGMGVDLSAGRIAIEHSGFYHQTAIVQFADLAAGQKLEIRIRPIPGASLPFVGDVVYVNGSIGTVSMSMGRIVTNTAGPSEFDLQVRQTGSGLSRTIDRVEWTIHKVGK